MLKQRIVTALIIAPLIIAATLYLSTPVFAGVTSLIFVLGAWEWAGLSGLSRNARFAYSAALLLIFGTASALALTQPSAALIVVMSGAVWWVAALLLVLNFPASGAAFRTSASRCVAGLFVLPPALAGLVLLHAYDPRMALLVVLLVSFADIGAYFAGKRFGRHKLAPRVSPGKTWEGLAGALALVIVTAYVAANVLAISGGALVAFVALCVVAVLASVVGDLTESLFKRLADAKDSGSLLPGHGGVLDRIDSITAAAPVFAAGISYLKVAA